MTKAWSATAVVAILAGSLAMPAVAQEVSDTADVIPLQPVVVNVLRTPFELTTAPFSVAVNGQADVQRARPGLGLDEALGGIPGVQVDDRYNYALGDRISIRGFGARTQFGVRGVKVYVDGVPATLPDGQTNLNHVDLSFLRRVEVIRGPASSLYGNAAGGVIQFESEIPPAVPISQEIGIVGGSDGLLRLHSTTGGQSGGATYVLNVARLTYDGYREYQDADNLQVTGSVGVGAAGGDLRVSGSFVDYDANNPGSLDADRLEADRDQACCRNASGGIQNNLLFQTGESGRQGQLGAFWQRDLGGGGLELGAYGIMREIENPIPNVIIDLKRAAGGLRALYRSAVSPSSLGLQWSLGFDADLQMDDRLNYRNLAGAQDTIQLNQDEKVLGTSVFTQLSATPMSALTLLAGLRLDATRFDVQDDLVTASNPDDSGDRTMSAISPSVGLSYEVAPAVSLFGNIATSFETPTTSELANQASGAGGFNPDLEPQKTLSFEAGVKGLITNFVSYQFAAYRANVDDSLIPFEIVGAQGRSFFRNAGSAVHQGIEAGFTIAPVDGIRANVAYTYLDARFDDYTVGSNTYDDNRIPGVSPHRVDGSLTFTAPVGLYATVEGRYADNMPVNDANTAVSPAYHVFDARTGLERLMLGGIAIEPFVGVTNLFDEEYNTSVTVNAFGTRFFEPGPGRAFYVGGQLRLDVD